MPRKYVKVTIDRRRGWQLYRAKKGYRPEWLKVVDEACKNGVGMADFRTAQAADVGVTCEHWGVVHVVPGDLLRLARRLFDPALPDPITPQHVARIVRVVYGLEPGTGDEYALHSLHRRLRQAGFTWTDPLAQLLATVQRNGLV